MLTAEIKLPLPGGGWITYEEALSVFTVYAVTKRQDCYILIPKPETEGIQGKIIVANETGIRICHNDGWSEEFVSNVLKEIANKDGGKLMKMESKYIPTDMQYKITSELINQIQYKSK